MKAKIEVDKQTWMSLLKIERTARKFIDCPGWVKADELHDALDEFEKIKNE